MFGGALAGLASPAGLAAAGIGLVVGGLTKMVTKTLDVGRSVGERRGRLPAYRNRERGRFTSRAIEETNGDCWKVRLMKGWCFGFPNPSATPATGNKAAQQGFQRSGAVLGRISGQYPPTMRYEAPS